MATFEFSFPASAAGLAVVIRDADGAQVATATAGEPDRVQGAVVVTNDLDVGEYVAEATNASTYYSARAFGVLDVPATISDLEGAAGGGLSAGDISATSPATWDAGTATIGVNVSAVNVGSTTGNLPSGRVSGLSAVATSGAYGELSGTPVAAHVADADGTDTTTLAASVDALRDALVAAGLMAAA